MLIKWREREGGREGGREVTSTASICIWDENSDRKREKEEGEITYCLQDRKGK